MAVHPHPCSARTAGLIQRLLSTQAWSFRGSRADPITRKPAGFRVGRRTGRKRPTCNIRRDFDRRRKRPLLAAWDLGWRDAGRLPKAEDCGIGCVSFRGER